jgi:asparagine synthetase B (glutamine-hydrolysing)
MCGIAGIYRIGKRPIRSWQLQMLATKLQNRGEDATGFALMDPSGHIKVFKNNDPAWRLCASKDFEDFCRKNLNAETQIALIHTRKWTVGSPVHNENNHPIVDGAGCIIHNGMVGNDDVLFNANKDKLKRSCQTDSDIFRAILDHHGCIDKELIEDMGAVNGTAAVAAIHPNSPGKLLLLRDSNPLVIGATPDTIMFASTKEAIHAALKPWVKMHNIDMQVHAPNLSFVPMPNEAGWIIGPKGLEDFGEFRCNGSRRQGNLKYSTSTNYFERKNRAEIEAALETSKKKTGTALTPTSSVPTKVSTTSEASSRLLTSKADPTEMPDWVICPNAECGFHVQLAEDQKGLDSLSLLLCGNCNANLHGAVVTIIN